MAETFITQCPHCGTSFRVSDEQLAIANGSVRCGACLQVFSARNHIPPGSAPKKAKPATGSRMANPAKPLSRPAPKKPVRSKPTSSAPKHPPSRFILEDDDDTEFVFADNPEEDDEFIFKDSDEDGDDSELGALSDTFIKLNHPLSGSHTANPFRHEVELGKDLDDDPETPDESWAESILEELEREEKQDSRRQEKARTKGQPTPNKRSRKKAADAAARTTDRTADHGQKTSKPSIANFNPNEHRASVSSVVGRLHHDIDLDFDAEERLARWRWLGGVFIVLLMVILLAQLAWLQRDTYAKMDQWRGLYQAGCNVIGCSLPAQQDITQIRTSNVLIRDHRALNNVKLLDAVLTNRAPFRQPYPQLILQYTDVNGDLVADQSFAPQQYLRGELTGSRLMPVNTRIYVSLPVRDPGSRAVNYQLVLAPADPG